MGPKTLDELLELIPGLRKCRNLNASTLRMLLDRKKGECTWCGRKVEKGQLKWCRSRGCFDEWSLRCMSSVQATYVATRDKYICQICGRDVKQAELKYREQRKLLDSEWRGRRIDKHFWELDKQLRRQFGGDSSCKWFEIDHIIPVSEGGGLLGPSNLRLLCCTCHSKETRKLRRRLAKAKS